MKKIYNLLFTLLTIASFSFLISCQGPPGVAGSDGADGANGIDGTDGADGANGNGTCLQCHNEGTSFKAKQIQFDESAHSLGTYYSRGGECSGCHSTEGFLAREDFTSITEITELDLEDQTPIACRTCHTVHYTYTDNDWALTFYDEVTETLFGSESPDYSSTGLGDLGNSNQCVQCHQARDRGNVPGADATEAVEVNSHWGPHYGVQGNVLASSGGVEVGTGYSTDNFHKISNACITCHMHNNSHTLEVNLEACIGCHSSTDNAETKLTLLQESIHEKLFELGAILADQGVMVEEIEDGEIVGYAPEGGTINAKQAKALWNYQVVYEDHSYGVHNPSYIKKLLNNSIDLVK